MADGGAESSILNRCKECMGEEFEYSGNRYKVIQCSKPSGESKTDLFIVAKNIGGGNNKVFKISYKKHSYTFVENKVRRYRIEEIFGSDWSNIIQSQINTRFAQFKKHHLVNKEKKKITIGWRYEIEQADMVKSHRTLSASIKQDIASRVIWGEYAGNERRDAKVDGVIIPNSGIPDYIVIADPEELSTWQDFFDKLKDIKKYAREHNKMQASFITQNWRWSQNKEKWVTEGTSRDFVVWVKWRTVNGMLEGQAVLDQPFQKKAKDIVDDLKNCLEEMNIPMDSKLMENLNNNISDNTVLK